MRPEAVTDRLIQELQALQFGPPVTHVYNPLVYARRSYDQYWQRYGAPPREIVLLGMNPGPWGMTQTGVPFGEVEAVRSWLQIETDVGRPEREHPKRPVRGFECQRSEVSGRRLWGWARATFQSPTKFFSRFFVANYCPLLLLEESGRNRTPNVLPAAEREPLLAACDRALLEIVKWFEPRYVIGVGRFAEERARTALQNHPEVQVGGITHPSPANPRANRDWEGRVQQEFQQLGIRLAPG